MRTVQVGALPLERLASLLPPQRARIMLDEAARAREAFGDRVIWHVNATARGGGVAEMLQTLLAYGRGAGIENRWCVLEGDPAFFELTKRLHNLLHGEPGDGGELDGPARAHYEAVLAGNLRELLPELGPRDLILLHDPQTAGMAPGLRAGGYAVAWRCHIGRDEPNACTESGWAFLRPYLEDVQACVFSRREYAPSWMAADRVHVIAPSIDPFAAKNLPLSGPETVAILATAGLVSGTDPAGPVHFPRRAGGTGVVRRGHPLSTGAADADPPPPVDVPLVVQVSRWDRLKDMAGVMAGFELMLARHPDLPAHVMLAGPAAAGVADDPEGAAVLAACRTQWRDLSPGVRRRVHLAELPMEDVDENAVIVNALQRHATVVVQKSLREGFGLTVTEAMWKGRPVLASRVGGIQDQIEHDRNGLLLDDPADLGAFADALAGLLRDPARVERLGAAGHRSVFEDHLGDRHLERYVDLFAAMARWGGQGRQNDEGPGR